MEMIMLSQMKSFLFFPFQSLCFYSLFLPDALARSVTPLDSEERSGVVVWGQWGRLDLSLLSALWGFM